MVDTSKYLNAEVEHHCREVTEVVKFLCKELKIEKQETQWLCRAAEIHDIGKWYISDNILNSADSLNKVEREVVDMHSLWGYMLAKQEGESGVVCDLILLHHGEKYITDLERKSPAYELYPILMAADIYSAMMSNRSYRMAVNHFQAVNIVSAKVTNVILLDALKQYQCG